MFGDPVDNPKNWKTKSLLTLGSCKNGMNFHSNDSGVEINCLGVGDFKDYDYISRTKELPTVSLNDMPSEDYLLKDGDIVFVRSNGNKTMVGRSVAVYPGDNPTTFSGFCIRYRNEDDSISVPFLLRVLKTDSIRMQMYGRGANIQNLNQQTLASLNIPVPPMDMQERYCYLVQQTDKSKSFEEVAA
jgi:type I restriction enzyme S subunit